ncbi:MAG: hypothetical protein K2M20_12035, partial [Lachnospiraceae bacterium]|nr:hypothetical protein [Lachnospiraceae bacterium]
MSKTGEAVEEPEGVWRKNGLKKRIRGRSAAGILLCAGAVSFAGCGAGNGMGQNEETEQPEISENDVEAETAGTPEDTAERRQTHRR